MVCLNNTGYQLWKEKMKNFLLVKNLHLPVFATQKSEYKYDEHQQVCGFIQQCVEDNVYNDIANDTCKVLVDEYGIFICF